jgi:hypothetical protein
MSNFFPFNIKQKLSDADFNHINNISAKKAFWMAVLFLVAVFFISFDTIWWDYNLQEGESSSATIVAPAYIEVIDIEKSEELRIAAAEKVVKAYDFDLNIEEEMLGAINANIEEIKKIAVEEITLEEKRVKFMNLTLEGGKDFVEADIDQILQNNEESFNSMKLFIEEIIRAIWDAGIKEEDIASIQRIIENQISESNWNHGNRELMLAIVIPKLLPNMVLNAELTQARIDEAIGNVPEIKKQILQGQIIVSEGEEVTRQHIAELEALGLQNSPVTLQGIFGQILLLVIIFFLLLSYLYFFKADILKDDRKLFLLACILLFVIGVAKIIYVIADENQFAGYLIPTATGSLLVAMLLDKRAGLYISIILGILAGTITGFSFQFTTFAIISGLVAVLSVTHLNQRTDLIRAALIVGFAGFLTVFALELVAGNPLLQVLQISSLGFINGVAASILAGGLLPFLEGPFGIVTEPRLLELNNPNSALLKKLMLEAPGTYHHSIIVGNLAEAAAQAIGASALLARVGALYHDIGKLKRPYFFIENQVGADNPHDKLAPSLSNLIIISHPRDGAEMAKKERLPAEITDIIRQHHGTGLLSFFYHRALELEKIEKKHKIIESDFRYPGPKPKSKEAAIVMLADSVEAALRAMGKPTAGVVDGQVRKIIKERLADGQLDEADLTLHEIDLITDAFLKVLAGHYHARIVYPDEKEFSELVRRRANANKN